MEKAHMEIMWSPKHYNDYHAKDSGIVILHEQRRIAHYN